MHLAMRLKKKQQHKNETCSMNYIGLLVLKVSQILRVFMTKHDIRRFGKA